jgi:transcriptional regulator with GAF, ATPase, and Fis domain
MYCDSEETLSPCKLRVNILESQKRSGHLQSAGHAGRAAEGITGARVRAVGGGQSIRVDVRVIAATNRNLKAAVAVGNFREDLYCRLNVFPLEMPPLRARRADIPLLVEYFIDRYARKAGKNIRCVDKKTLQLLQWYPWPGNIRELQTSSNDR